VNALDRGYCYNFYLSYIFSLHSFTNSFRSSHEYSSTILIAMPICIASSPVRVEALPVMYFITLSLVSFRPFFRPDEMNNAQITFALPLLSLPFNSLPNDFFIAFILFIVYLSLLYY